MVPSITATSHGIAQQPHAVQSLSSQPLQATIQPQQLIAPGVFTPLLLQATQQVPHQPEPPSVFTLPQLSQASQPLQAIRQPEQLFAPGVSTPLLLQTPMQSQLRPSTAPFQASQQSPQRTVTQSVQSSTQQTTPSVVSWLASLVPCPSTPLLVSGYPSQPPSFFHFGGTPSPPQFFTDLPVFTREDTHILLTRHALSLPGVASRKRQWCDAINRLFERPGACHESLMEAKGYILFGISSQLTTLPAPTHYRNSSTLDAVLPECWDQLQKYMALGAVEEIHESPILCHPLLAVIKEGCNPRMCLDLSRNFNEFLDPQHFNLQAIHTAVEISTPYCYYAKLDLSSCFLTFPLSPAFAAMMTFRFGGKFYRFNNMPFGLSSAPRIASLLLDVVSSVLYDKGVRHTRYLDDFLFIGTTPEAVTLSLIIACQVFESFGLMLNTKKIEGPSQQMPFLGLLLDSVAQTVSLPASKKADAKALISSILAKERVTSKTLRSLLGKLSFLSSVLPAARPFMRQCIDAASNPNFSRPRRLSNSFKQELRFWLENLDVWDGTRKWMLSAEPFVFASDASTEGFGYVVESVPPSLSPLPSWVTPGYAVAGVWSNSDAAQYSHRQIGFGEMFSQ